MNIEIASESISSAIPKPFFFNNGFAESGPRSSKSRRLLRIVAKEQDESSNP
jgi:hypothetical protein